ncbi:CCC motif membrane protein [Pseudotenacibaculum haliotis]|uniref:CCC motif membrane protein n=1 Tax=Pseudotenacibaculum haliotis TaxID=1862138 RepID=A0ABW5LVS5_9FLAO
MERSTLPNSTASLVLGILSIVTCICYGIIGLPLGIIAVILGAKAKKIFNENPDAYKSVGNASAGVVTGIIGIILNLIYLGFIVWLISSIGWDALQDPELMQERLLNL